MCDTRQWEVDLADADQVAMALEFPGSHRNPNASVPDTGNTKSISAEKRPERERRDSVLDL